MKITSATRPVRLPPNEATDRRDHLMSLSQPERKRIAALVGLPENEIEPSPMYLIMRDGTPADDISFADVVEALQEMSPQSHVTLALKQYFQRGTDETPPIARGEFTTGDGISYQIFYNYYGIRNHWA